MNKGVDNENERQRQLIISSKERMWRKIKGCFGNETRGQENKKSRDVVLSVVANPKRDSLVEGDKQKGVWRATRDR